MSKKKKMTRTIRTVVQICFFILVFLISFGHFLEESGITLPFVEGASLHAVCPFGGVVSLYQYITAGSFVQKIHESSFILMLLVFLTAILFGPVFCGWICPFGSIQEWVAKIGKRLLGKRHNNIIPQKVDSILRYFRYGILVWVIIVTAYSTKLLFANVDPYYALFNFWTGEIAIGGIIILVVVLALSLVVERPFCKYACPYGALLGLTNLFSIFRIRRNASTCISCSLCDKACPMNITVSEKKTIRNHQCISCYNCTSEVECPIQDTVLISTSPLEQKTGDKKAAMEVKNEN